MRLEDSRHLFAVRSLALASLVAVLSVLAPVVVRAEQDTCESDTEKPRDTVAPTRPGPWREDLKRESPRIRVPGTRTVAPQDPLSIDATTHGRWVPGYRPATAEAQAEFDAWKATQRATLGTADAGRLALGASSSYAANLLSGARTAPGPDEPITHTVRGDKYEISPVDLRTLPASAEAESTQPRAGKPERDTGYHHLSGMTWAEYLWSKKQAEFAPPTPDGQNATAVLPSSLAPPFTGVGFDAILSDFTGAPPDPIMAVGPGHLVAIVNSRYRVWDKSGNPLTPAISLNQFFMGVANCSGVFDVFVDYDEALDRFVMGGETLVGGGGATDSYLCVAATATGDPAGVWNRTSFRADLNEPSTWIDYPHMGIGLDAIYIAGNMFSDGGGFHHIGAFAVDKTALYQGAAVPVAEANLGGQFFTAQPVKLHGFDSGGWPPPGTPHHMLAGNGGGSTRIWRWSNPFQTGPTIYGTLIEASFNGSPPSADELGAAQNGRNDTGSSKWLDAEYRHGKLWATRNVACNFGGGNAESCVDWIQVDVSGATPLLEQQQTGGAYGSTGDFRYYPDLSVDANDNLAIGYTKSSATSYTQVWVTGREANDPPGTLQSETLRRAGLGNYFDGIGCQGSCDRWGDYTGMTVDPDGCTFWYLGQYSDGGNFNWATHIGSFRYDSCSTDSLLQIDQSTYTCNDSMTVTVTDSVPIDAATVSAQTTLSTSTGDAETIAAGSWTGSDCAGGVCGTWTATIPVGAGPVSAGDGTVDVTDGGTITVQYADPHAGHGPRSRSAGVTCQTHFEDGGYLIDGGCESGQGAERYRDYMDGGELIAYTFGVFYPPNAPRLTDVQAQLAVSGPAASKVTVLDPTVHLGALEPGTLTAPVFTIYIDPSIDVPALRMTTNAFNLSITSAGDGLTVPQVLTQSHLLQADDNIVGESGCWNFESGDQGFVQGPIYNSYTCNASDCGILRQIDTVPAPWTRGVGCGSETRTDDAGLACDTGGTSAFKTNADPATCGTFTQTANTLVDSALYSPIFVPAHTGLAANGQPWSYRWLNAQWYYRSDMMSLLNPALAVGFLWDPNYAGTDLPGPNEVYDFYPYFLGYFTYLNQSWDSAMPWHPRQPPANFDSVGFSNSATGPATAGLKWRWAVEVFDTDFGGNPLETPATAGLALDNLSLVYEQYHAAGQTGACADPAGVVAFDQYSYVECPEDALTIHVLDGTAGPVRVTVTSDTTGDSETLTIQGTAPRFTGTLPYSTAAGPRANDGTLFVTPADLVRVTYADGSGVPPAAQASIACAGGDVVTEGLAGLTDNGDGDTFADANETVNISIRIRNNTAQALHNVVVILDSDDPTVDCISKSTASFGTIASGAAATNNLLSDPFTFKVSGSAACTDPAEPPTATFRVLILADGFAGPLEPQEVTLLLDMNDVGGTVTYIANFTAGPSGFVHRLGPGDDNGAASDPNGYTCSPYSDEFFWRGTGGNPGGGYFCWQDPADTFPNGDYGDLSDSALYSPVLKIGANTTTLSFDHEYLFGWAGSFRVDGARVDYRVNGGAWRKLSTLPYDGVLIYNTYCNPLCNGTELAKPCFSEVESDGELIFNQLNQGPIPWRSVSGVLGGLTPGDLVQFRWRVGSMNSSAYGVSTQGGYGLDNVSATNVIPQVCDTAVRPDVGCGVVFHGFGNLIQVCGDDDALVEPTETWTVDVTLRNSGPTSAVTAVADLVVGTGSSVPATVSGNPGAFGTLAGNGGTGTARYEFVVGAQATCVDELLFDVTNIATAQATHADQPSAFTIPVGGIGLQQNASQSVDPLLASNKKKLSSLAPALTVPTPAHRVTLDYAKSYINPSSLQTEHQTVDPLAVENTTVSTTLGAPFTVNPDDAASAVVDWTSLSHPTLTSCVRVFLQTPTGATLTLKAIGAAAANPYDVLNVYKNLNGGSGQYRIGVEEVASGPCKQQATLSGATMSVSKAPPTANWTANVRVSLWDGTAEHVIKNFGSADAAPYDVTAIYNAAGPGSYEVLLEENGAGGEAALFGAVLNVSGVECDAPCASNLPAPPAVGLRLARGASPDEIQVTIDNATCSASRAVVVYGNLGDYTHYQGAVGGCDIGTGPTATITHAGSNVWFNVLWVNESGTAGHPGFGTSGPRSWNAAGLCSVVDDDRSDPVCD